MKKIITLFVLTSTLTTGHAQSEKGKDSIIKADIIDLIVNGTEEG